MVGKTNMDQFAAGLVGTRSPYGCPRNPFDDRFLPGGSSSGSGAAVGAGRVCFALGTDTAGSGARPPRQRCDFAETSEGSSAERAIDHAAQRTSQPPPDAVGCCAVHSSARRRQGCLAPSRACLSAEAARRPRARPLLRLRGHQAHGGPHVHGGRHPGLPLAGLRVRVCALGAGRGGGRAHHAGAPRAGPAPPWAPLATRGPGLGTLCPGLPLTSHAVGRRASRGARAGRHWPRCTPVVVGTACRARPATCGHLRRAERAGRGRAAGGSDLARAAAAAVHRPAAHQLPAVAAQHPRAHLPGARRAARAGHAADQRLRRARARARRRRARLPLRRAWSKVRRL